MARVLARPIKSQRDYKSAASVVHTIRQQPKRESDEEHRLQALIKEMEKYDDQDDDGDADGATEEIDGLPRRRWSDDGSERE